MATSRITIGKIGQLTYFLYISLIPTAYILCNNTKIITYTLIVRYINTSITIKNIMTIECLANNDLLSLSNSDTENPSYI